jgi:hypothetical protein
MLQLVLVVLIGAHGIGHIVFLVSLLGLADWGQPAHSWLLTSDGLAKLAGSVLWLVALIGFCAAAYGLATQQSWWRNAAVIAAVVSIVGLILFWTSPLTSPALSAFVFDAVVLFALVVLHLPGPETVGA